MNAAIVSVQASITQHSKLGSSEDEYIFYTLWSVLKTIGMNARTNDQKMYLM